MFFKKYIRLFTIIKIFVIFSTSAQSLHDGLLNSFSSKTAYRNSKLLEFKNEINTLSECKLVHLNALFRHGTRFPSKKDMRKIKIVHKKILSSDSGRKNLPKEFLDWKSSFSFIKNMELSSVGFEEMRLLGQRFRHDVNSIDGFHDLLRHIKVLTSSIKRSKLSAVTFIRNFLNNVSIEAEVQARIIESDDKLRFFKDCPYYKHSVLHDKSSKMEYNKFLHGSEIKEAIKEIREKWNLSDVNLSADDIRTLYIMCGYEIATNISSKMKPKRCPLLPSDDDISGCPFEPMFVPEETSPLCTLLKPEHFHIFEYLDDLKHYWTKSYARGINWKQSCALMLPMLRQIRSAMQGHEYARKLADTSRQPLVSYLDQQKYPRAVFWFGHAETLLPLITLLDLFNQTSTMTSTMFHARLASLGDPSQRFSTFRVSNISPFSGNVALRLYHCPNMTEGGLSGYRIQVRSNEKAVSWALAAGGSHISVEGFLRHMASCDSGKFEHKKICAERRPPKDNDIKLN